VRLSNPTWQIDQAQAHLKTIQRATIKVFSVQKFNPGPYNESSAVVATAEMLGQKQRLVRVNLQTNAGVGEFNIEFAQFIGRHMPPDKGLQVDAPRAARAEAERSWPT